ncbi:MAG: HigA family addiction module antidote protein [SAR324 cluster bacterium]|nr:HigA family addiction module antidote protein [SAR324 cluster bacterium]
MTEMKRKPTHPGYIIKEDYLIPLNMTITEMASIIGVSRKTLSKIINENGAITPDMALRLSQALDTTPDLWLNLQKNFDLWEASHSSSAWKTVQSIPSQLLHSH